MTNLVDLITPVNLAGEKEKFFGSSLYNPIFHYTWQDNPADPHFVSDRKRNLWRAIREQNHNTIVSSASALFEVEIEPHMAEKARAHAKASDKRFSGSAEEYASLLRNDLNFFGLDNIVIEIRNEGGFNSRPDHSHGRIVVSREIHFGLTSMEGGVRHEMAHIIRYANGKYNKVKRSERYLPTEEGLASWCQDHTTDDNALAQHAMEYVGSSIGINGSLRDIYNVMRELGMDGELAWKRASRHKFGFVDTGKPGDILKPAMYYANEMKINGLSTGEKVRLFTGKINQNELPAYPEYRGRWTSEKLIEYFKL